MCRYDEDYAWTVDSMKMEMATEPQQCEDCGRTIPTGEYFWQIIGVSCEYDDRPLIWGAMLVGRFLDSPGARFIEVAEEHADIWERAGFRVDEDYDPRLKPEPIYAEWCCHCRAANHWLAEVCDQSVVLVARDDLLSHLDDYGPEDLGPDFMALAELAERRWHREEMLVPVETVRHLAERAVEHAVAVGLHP